MMNKYGEVLEDGSLLFVRVLPGPIERVWSYLTEAEKRAKWLAGGETSKTPGGRVEFKFNNQNLSPHDDPVPEKYKEMGGEVSFEGEVLTYEPPRLLRFSWPDRDGTFGEVTYSLSEVGDQVRLELKHKGISDADDLIGASSGWHVHFDILEAIIANETPPPFWAEHQKAETEYAERHAGHIAAMSRRADP